MVHLVLSDQGDWHPKNPSELDSLLDSEELQSRVRPWPNREHYFVRWRAADWHAGGLSHGDNSAGKRNQIVRRFYLLGKTPEQQALADLLTALKWISTEVERPLALAGTGRESLLIHLAAAACSEWRTARVQELFTDQFPNDPLLTACLPGMLQICEPADVRKLTQRLFSCRDQSPLAPLSTRLLVDTSSAPRQATGMRILEVTDRRAKIWVRATRWPLANLGGLPQVEFSAGQGKRRSGVILPESGVEGLRYAVPGVEAEVRVGYRPRGTGNLQYSAWQAVSADSDFSALITLEDLQSDTAYEVRTQVRSPSQPGQIFSLAGSFKSLPAPNSKTSFRLAVATCQGFNDRDGPHGFDLYRSMLDRDTDAFVMAGDVVYYDRLARSVELAHYHWQRTYSLPTLFEFHRRVPAFFLKDDHDTYVDDSWPESDYPWTEDFTFQAGQRIFQQQTGLPDPAYRTFQVGSDLQVWLMEGRDFRSPNTKPDGPQKTIWGQSQKEWLKDTLSKSTSVFKVIISPTPLVGPDRENKRDNHSNAAFETEGREVRQLIAEHPNAVVVCGDRHWQYHSVDPQTGLHEFSVGPASDRHAGGWKQEDYRPEKHRFLRVAGGYLEMELQADGAKSKLIFRHLDTLGNEMYRHVLSDTPEVPADDSK
jgi:alkaline phosphatase D